MAQSDLLDGQGGAGLPQEALALCEPFSGDDPCGPDLDAGGDAAYLDFFANVEGLLPVTFFSEEDGSPFDRTRIDIPAQIAAMQPLLARTRDIRLLVLRARLTVLDRDLAGFAHALAATAWWLENFWDAVHPRPVPGEPHLRASAVGTLELPTVIFPLQYVPLADGRRLGPISYRSWMIANGEVAPRPGDAALGPTAVMDAVSAADGEALAAVRSNVALVKRSVDAIRAVFYGHGEAPGLDRLSALVDLIAPFIAPPPAAGGAGAGEGEDAAEQGDAPAEAGGADAVASLAAAREALSAIAAYYSRCEPSSPTLLLVRQAHDLIGKSFFEVMRTLVPSHFDRATFHIGGERYFELPLERLASYAQAPQDGAAEGAPPEPPEPPYTVESRVEAIALIDKVHQYFRRFEPSSPIPMLCERARALANQSFMEVLKNVLPSDSLRDINNTGNW